MSAESETLSAEGVEGGYYSLAEIPRDDDDEFGSTPVASSASSIGSLGHALAGVLSSGSSFFGVGGGGGEVSSASTQPPSGLRLANPVEIHPTSGGGGGQVLSRDVSGSSYDPETTEEAYTPQSAPAGQALTQDLIDLTLNTRSQNNRKRKEQLRAYIKSLIRLENLLGIDTGIDRAYRESGLETHGTKDEILDFLELDRIKGAIAHLISERKSQKGKGLRRKKPRISGTGVKPAKVAPIERYGRIGDHIIKLQPLEKNILTINTPNGWAVKGLPSKTISSNLVNVFKEIVGEGVPKYSSIEDLTEGEKDFLNKIARITKIEDRVKVKTPTKTDLDKLVNRFEILKGEICAGNNSNELVKEFKKIIMTLSNEGMLPKGQAREILMDLVSLGF
jgi:hypothetical protein